ncbi:DUF1566 domain-containing protein [bacterium]|nr:DUF1566 domain-containing protein [bacterium]
MAVDYCTSLNSSNYGGYSSGWHLPTISELRTLIQNCSNTESEGECGVTESCLSYSECRYDACSGCSSDSSGKYSKFGETGGFWSSSTELFATDYAWSVGFSGGRVSYSLKSNKASVRCVR